MDMYSFQNRTEYLGKRSNVGFVKLYNKSIESKLDYDLSRLEITCEPNVHDFFQYVPNVYYIGLSSQLGMDIESLNDTDKYILTAEWKLLTNGLQGYKHRQYDYISAWQGQ